MKHIVDKYTELWELCKENGIEIEEIGSFKLPDTGKKLFEALEMIEEANLEDETKDKMIDLLGYSISEFTTVSSLKYLKLSVGSFESVYKDFEKLDFGDPEFTRTFGYDVEKDKIHFSERKFQSGKKAFMLELESKDIPRIEKLKRFFQYCDMLYRSSRILKTRVNAPEWSL